MKLVDVAYGLPHEQFGKDPLRDMQRLYGGGVSRFGTHRSLNTADDYVHAFNEGKRPTITHIAIGSLGLRVNAARWTALQAYRERGGAAVEHLATEVPGLRGYQEWRGRRQQAQIAGHRAAEATLDAAVEDLVIDTSLSGPEFDRSLDGVIRRDRTAADARLASLLQPNFYATTSEGTGNSATDRYFDALSDNLAQGAGAVMDVESALRTGDVDAVDRAQRRFLGVLAAGDGLTVAPIEESPHDHTVFYAHGSDLPTAARAMATGYSELAFHTDDPDMAVAGSLGVGSLTQLDALWEQAMAERSPLAAGQLVVRYLSN